MGTEERQGRTLLLLPSRLPERTSLLVRLTTTDGLVDWGEGGQHGPTEPVKTRIDGVLSPALLEMPTADRPSDAQSRIDSRSSREFVGS